MKVAITSDHQGYNLKEKIKKYLQKQNITVIDCGTNSTESVDFPIYAKKLAETITKENLEYGIAICKTGIGMSIALNKMKGLTCAKVCSIKESYLSRLHNDANVLALSNNLPFWKVKKIVKAFLTTKPLTEEKYVRRRNQIKEYEND